MRFYLLRVVAFFCRRITSLRYSVHSVGEENLEVLDPQKGILFLANHPGQVDGLLLAPFLWSKYFVRPIVVDYVTNIFFMRPLVWISRTLSIPNLERIAPEKKIQEVHSAIHEIVDGLKKGERFLLYPAGRLRLSGKEVLGGASALYRILQEIPDVQIVLLRVRGLWGSSFSRAIIGSSPHVPLAPLIWKGIKILLKNGIFFCPKRDIDIEISTNVDDFPRKGSRWTINRYLENRYNNYPNGVDSEPMKLVSHSFWCDDVDQPYKGVPEVKKRVHIPISETVKESVYAKIRLFLDDSEKKMDPELSLSTDLGLDSLDLTSLAAEIAGGCSVDELHLEIFATVRDVLEFAQSRENKYERFKC